MANPTDPTRYREVKDKLTVAFRALRKEGMIARQNYLCCGTCASAGCYQEARKRDEAGKVVTGAVYYHRQNNESLENSRDLYIAYDEYEPTGGPAHLTTAEVGRKLAAALKDAGLTVEWDGSPDLCVKVVFYPGLPEEKVTVLREIEDGSFTVPYRSRWNDNVLRVRAFDLVLREGLVSRDTDGNYVLTDKGRAFLEVA